MRKLKKTILLVVILVVIGFVVIIVCYSLLSKSSVQWKINTLEVPNIVRRNPITIQSGIKKAITLREFEIRIAAFQILRPKGGPILGRVAQLWHERELLQVYSIGFKEKNVYLRFKNKRIEVWADADKFFKVSGQIIIRLSDKNDRMLANNVVEVAINYQPYLIK